MPTGYVANVVDIVMLNGDVPNLTHSLSVYNRN